MSYTSYGGSAKQDNARLLFAERSAEAGKLMRAGHSKQDAWAMVCGHAKKPVHHRVPKEMKEKKPVHHRVPKEMKEKAEGGAILAGAVLAGRVHHKKPSVHHRRVGLALREHL